MSEETDAKMQRIARYGRAAKALSQSIRRGTQHFDRDHTKELFRDCICGDTVDPACPLHEKFNKR